MERRDARHLLGVSLATAVLALFENWAAHLPAEEAGVLDFCRFSPVLDCLKSVNAHGASLAIFSLPVLPALAALTLFMTAIGLLALCGSPEATPWGFHAAFPASGLALYQVLDHILSARSTSVDALLLAALLVWACVRGVQRGLRHEPAAAGGRSALGALLFALLAGFLLNGAGRARLEAAELRRSLDSSVPNIVWPAFDEQMPREGAPLLGDPAAPEEMLVFLDPAQEESRGLVRECLAVHSPVRMVFFGTGEMGLAMIGGGEAALRAIAEGRSLPPPASPRPALHGRQERHRLALGVTRFPTVRWRGGQASGEIDLPAILQKVAR